MNLLPKWLRKSVNDAVWREETAGVTADTISVRAANAQSKSLSPTEQYELSIAVNAAVNAICRNLSKARIRCFSQTGMEVTGGPLYDLLKMPAPKFSQRKLLWEIADVVGVAIDGICNKKPRLIPCLSVEIDSFMFHSIPANHTSKRDSPPPFWSSLARCPPELRMVAFGAKRTFNHALGVFGLPMGFKQLIQPGVDLQMNLGDPGGLLPVLDEDDDGDDRGGDQAAHAHDDL